MHNARENVRVKFSFFYIDKAHSGNMYMYISNLHSAHVTQCGNLQISPH